MAKIRGGKRKMSELGVGDLTTPRNSGRYEGVSIGRDGAGFFVATHRSRSKSYDAPSKIPVSVIKKVKTTG